MRNLIWSTAGLNGGEALEHWRAIVGQSLFALDIETPEAAFQARIEQAALGPLALSKLSAGPQAVRRTRRGIAASRQPATMDVIGVRAGTLRFQQNGREDLLRPGDCVLLDRMSPYSFSASESCAMTLSLQHGWLAQWTAEPAALAARRIDGSSGWGRALSAMLAQLEVDALDGLALPGAVVADQIASLLVLACAPPEATARVDRRLVERARRVIRDHAHDPRFSPERAAAALGLSKRSLHALFAGLGSSFGRDLMSERLERARTMLEDARGRHVPVGEIAFRCGFVDQGHFSKRFRGRFGASPSALRAAAHR